MGPLGNANQKPADPSYNLPPKAFGAHSQDAAFYSSISVTLNVIFGFIIVVICFILVIRFTKNPKAITQEQGICYYRSTNILRLGTDAIKTFLRITTESLLSYRSHEYDASPLEYLVAEKIITAFNNLAEKQSDARKKSQRRQFWEVKEIRRYYNPELPNFIGIAVLGKKTVIQRSADVEQRSPDTYTSTALVVVYLKQQPPTLQNPWGLILEGVQEQTNPEKAKLIWQQSVDMEGTLDLEEKPFVAPRKEYIPIPMFEKIKFYNWLNDFNSTE